MYIDEDCSGGPHGEAVNFEIWSFSGTTGNMGRKDCGTDAFRGVIYRLIDCIQDRRTATEHRERLYTTNGENDFEHCREKKTGLSCSFQ